MKISLNTLPKASHMTSGFYLVRYYYPFPPVGQMLYHMELSIGGQQFHGKGRTRQAAKHDAAAKAIKTLQKEPVLQPLSEVGNLGTFLLKWCIVKDHA